MSFRDEWIKENVKRMRNVFPNEPLEDIKKYVEKEYDSNVDDPKCIIYNNYEKEKIDTTLIKLTDWINKTKPITTESGSLFKQHKDCWNPDTAILQGKLDERDISKKKMLEYKDLSKKETVLSTKNKLTLLSAKFNLRQKRCKVITNSEYGASGLPSSWFFNMACASATTARGQALISTAENAFEDFLADNVRFVSMDECIRFIELIIEERPNRKENDSKWIKSKSKEQVFDRLCGKFIDPSIIDSKIIELYIKNLDQEDLNRIYYKSNLEEFFRNSNKAKDIINDITFSTCQYLKPMEPPKKFKDKINDLRNAVLEFVHFNHPTIDRVNRLKFHTRKRVTTIDTDSNFINMGAWVRFVESEINNEYHDNDGLLVITRDEYKSLQMRRFRIVNSMIFIITKMIADTLDVFMDHCNLEDKNYNKAYMKNEFLYDTLLLTDAKKHYQGVVRIQEGKLFNEPELDCKGVEYMKTSMAGENTRKFIKDLIYNDVLCAKNAQPDIAQIIVKIRKFENNIKKTIADGEYSYFKTANIKTPDAYECPFSIGTYKAAFVWNYLNPETQIELPGVAYIAKTNIKKLKDISNLSEKYPEIYQKFTELFDIDIKTKDTKTGEIKNRKLGDGGINSIAIPLDTKMPEWLIDLIDVTKIIENNTKLITPALDALGIKTVYNSQGAKFVSGIIKI